ncbi:MAG: DNA topoisomerase VI subunit B [Candidatus Woesearchaeota archaeon]
MATEKATEKPPAKTTAQIAEEMSSKQREIGVAEFFARNRHLLGFDNKRKALLTTVKEAVDNALDACEEAGILPEVSVEIIQMDENRYRVIVEDNGPGITKDQIPKIFAKLLYGSKFHRLKMSRGQQGIGISACVLYAQLTTGKPAKIISKIDTKDAHYYELTIDTKSNSPIIIKDVTLDWPKPHGTRIELDIEATYLGGQQSVDEYLKFCAVSNPHASFIYTNPKAQQIVFPRVTDQLPPIPQEVKPHPAGVELGVLLDMLKHTSARTLQSFLTSDFSRVGDTAAKQICEHAALLPSMKPSSLSREQAEQLLKGIQKTKLMAPLTDSISPIGKETSEKGIKKEINAEFYATTTRSPSVYRGNPFIIEAGLAYGGEQPADAPARIIRFANRVPLQYQQGACAITKAITATSWRSYGLAQPQNALPVGPITIVVHIASVWVPYTSESKEAIAHYPEIIKEIKLALQEIGRDLGKYLAKKKSVKQELTKRSYIEKYIPHLAHTIVGILKLPQTEIAVLEEELVSLLEKHRGKLEEVDFDPEKNQEYDEEFASIGSDDEPSEEEDY